MTRQTSLLTVILEVTRGNVAEISGNTKVTDFCRLATTGKTAKVTIGDFHFSCENAGGIVTWNKTCDKTLRTLKY